MAAKLRKKFTVFWRNPDIHHNVHQGQSLSYLEERESSSNSQQHSLKINVNIILPSIPRTARGLFSYGSHTPIISPTRTIQLYQAESTLLDLMALVTSGAQ